MTENEMPQPQEQEKSPRAQKVEAAMDNAWKKPENSEYWEIRKQLEKRMAWHGMGVTKHFIDTVDGAANTMVKDKFLRGVVKTLDKPAGLWIGATAASFDIIYNTFTWGLRKVVPLPKDIAKRAVVYGTYAVAGATGATGVGYEGFKAQKELFKLLIRPDKLVMKVAKTETYQKGLKSVKAAGEAAFTAPEVAAIKAKQKIDAVMERMKKPNVPAKV